MSAIASTDDQFRVAPSAKQEAVACQLRDTLTDRDREAVRALITRTGFFRAEEIDVAIELIDERQARGAASRYEFLFAEAEGALIGYACYGPIACTVGSYDLYWIAVDPGFQRHGIGRRLLSGVESLVAKAGGRRIYIDTSGQEKYAPTRAFYERSGYQLAARLADFYAPGDDRVIYVKAIGTESIEIV
jgi:ribosomal protein S18 acetylase RimI-like enzyme